MTEMTTGAASKVIAPFQPIPTDISLWKPRRDRKVPLRTRVFEVLPQFFQDSPEARPHMESRTNKEAKEGSLPADQYKLVALFIDWSKKNNMNPLADATWDAMRKAVEGAMKDHGLGRKDRLYLTHESDAA